MAAEVVGVRPWEWDLLTVDEAERILAYLEDYEEKWSKING